MDQVFDVAIIGGGINGCGCAADAALRGLSVILLEQDDLASKTSSSSTKLIHGGLRYLEHYEFALVKKALEERQNLLQLAPHLVHPQSFILPHQKQMRPAWLVRLGLFFYDHLSKKNRLPPCRSIRRSKMSHYFNPLKDSIKRGFFFYDAATDDARLTLANAMQAKHHGALINTYSKVTHIEVINNLWHLTVQSAKEKSDIIQAKSLINAAGPWVESVAKMIDSHIKHAMTLVKGSHIIVPQLYDGKHAYLLQHGDKRVVFVIPYHGFSMIGTTDTLYQDSLDNPVTISTEEIHYLLGVVNDYFKLQLTIQDLLFSWSGIRPLISNEGKELKSLSRDYSYEFTKYPAPLVTLYGGKITTYRQLAEEAINQLKSIFPKLSNSKTKNTPLPGAIWDQMNFEKYLQYAKNKYCWLDKDLLNRYLYSYGTNTEHFLSSCTNVQSLGTLYGSSLYQIELDYLITHEWASNVDDVLNRRTKLGFTMDSSSKKALEHYLNHCNPTMNYNV